MSDFKIKTGRAIANHFFWVFILQGILAIIIALWVLAYPPVIIPLVAAMFLWQGVTAIFLAYRVREFRKENLDVITD